MLIPILSLVLAAPAPEPPADPPKGPAPRIMVFNTDKDGRPYFEGTVLSNKKVQRQVVSFINGQQQVLTQEVSVQVPEQKRIFLDEEGVAVYDCDGKKVEGKNLPKQNGPFAALVSADGKEVDPFYLPLARRGTLVIVAPALVGGQTGGPSRIPVAGTTGPGATATPPPGATVPKP